MSRKRENFDAIEELLEVNKKIKTISFNSNGIEKNEQCSNRTLILIEKFPKVQFMQ